MSTTIDWLTRLQNIENALWGGANIADAIPPLFSLRASGNQFFVDPAHGADTNLGTSPSNAFATLAAGYGALRSGYNDVLFLMSNGQSTGSARLSANFTWSKNAAHLIGVAAPSAYAQRARVAPTSGVAAFANFFTVSGSGCLFRNVEFFHGFNTGIAAAICMTLTGARNVYDNCSLSGMGDAASAADNGSRSLLIGGAGAGENIFIGGTIGLDTISRSGTNASIEFTGATPRNIFRGVTFPFMCSAGTILACLGAAASCLDRINIFEQCNFLNAAGSGSTTITALATLAASAGGALFFKNCTRLGISDYGSDVASRGQIYVDGPLTSNVTGLAAAPNV